MLVEVKLQQAFKRKRKNPHRMVGILTTFLIRMSLL